MRDSIFTKLPKDDQIRLRTAWINGTSDKFLAEIHLVTPRTIRRWMQQHPRRNPMRGK